MTIEHEITYNKVLDLNSINQDPFPLQQNEVIDESSDFGVSIKMVDGQNRTILLIEAEPRCINDDEPKRYEQGCFIRRFEYVEQFFHSPYSSLLVKFLKAFETRCRLRMIPAAEGNYLTNYHYLWAKRLYGEKCNIASLLELKTISTSEGCVFYKGTLQK